MRHYIRINNDNTTSFEVVNNNEYFDLILSINDKEIPEVLYLLYVLYSTGDSFSYRDGCIAYIGIYSCIEVAKENKKRIEKHNEQYIDDTGFPDHKNAYSLLLISEDGQEYLECPDWIGFFEDVKDICIESISKKVFLSSRKK